MNKQLPVEVIEYILSFTGFVDRLVSPQRVKREHDDDFFCHCLSYKKNYTQICAVSKIFFEKYCSLSKKGFFVTYHFFSDKELDEHTNVMRCEQFVESSEDMQLNHALNYTRSDIKRCFKMFEDESLWNTSSRKFGCVFQTMVLKTNNWHFYLFPDSL